MNAELRIDSKDAAQLANHDKREKLLSSGFYQTNLGKKDLF